VKLDAAGTIGFIKDLSVGADEDALLIHTVSDKESGWSEYVFINSKTFKLLTEARSIYLCSA